MDEVAMPQAYGVTLRRLWSLNHWHWMKKRQLSKPSSSPVIRLLVWRLAAEIAAVWVACTVYIRVQQPTRFSNIYPHPYTHARATALGQVLNLLTCLRHNTAKSWKCGGAEKKWVVMMSNQRSKWDCKERVDIEFDCLGYLLVLFGSMNTGGTVNQYFRERAVFQVIWKS